jgi:hypothetical protein
MMTPGALDFFIESEKILDVKPYHEVQSTVPIEELKRTGMNYVRRWQCA